MTLETKEATDLSPEAKAALDAIRKSFEELKTKNDKLEADIKAGREDVLTKQDVDKINADITAKLDELKSKLDAEAKEREGLESRLNKRGLAAVTTDVQAKACEINRIAKSHRKSPGQLTGEQFADYKSGIEKVLRRDELSDAERKAMSVGSDPAGGFFVTPDTAGEIVKFVHETSAMRQVANVRSLATDALEGKYKLGRAGAAWVGETQARAETATVDGGVWRIPAHELYAWPEISLKLLEDAELNAEAELAQDVADEFSRKEETAFFTGTGVNQPRGLLTYAAGTPANTSVATYEVIRQTGTGVSGDFAASAKGDIFMTVIGQTKQMFLPNASWMMNRLTLAETRKIKDGQGNYLWEKSFQANQPFILLGYPVVMAEDMPAIAGNSLSIAFGDFRQAYKILDRLGISVLVDPYTSTTGFVKYKTRKRVGGAVTNFEAVQLIKFG